MNDTLPLLHEGDAYVLELDISAPQVRLLSISRYPNNQNVEPTSENFRDLDPETKKAVVMQINRRYKGRMVKV